MNDARRGKKTAAGVFSVLASGKEYLFNFEETLRGRYYCDIIKLR